MRLWEYVVWFVIDPFTSEGLGNYKGHVIAETEPEAYDLVEDEIEDEDRPYVMNWYVREVADVV